MPGTLFIVSTPIGNLEDITLRALRVLKEVDVIAAEDTRHSRKLLTHFGIETPLISYFGAKEKIKAEAVMARLNEGKDVALISDAGTPGISDPGAVLVGRAVEAGLRVVPVPGASALTAALSASGLPTERFLFIGFLPPKATQRRKALELLHLEKNTTIFYEAPHRVLEAVEDMEEAFGGERRAAMAREITKIHEEFFRGTLEELSQYLAGSTIAGEYVIIVEGRSDKEISEDQALREMKALMKSGVSRRDAARRVAEAYGLSRKRLYDESLA